MRLPRKLKHSLGSKVEQDRKRGKRKKLKIKIKIK
jgi:hypothetical protein